MPSPLPLPSARRLPRVLRALAIATPLATAWLVGGSAFAQAPTSAPAPLSLPGALQLAQQRSLQLPAQDAAASAARDMGVAAGQRPDPVLKAGLVNLPITGPDRFSVTRDFMTMRSVGVMQEFTRADKLQARAARFDGEARAAEAGREVALAELQRDTATAWLERHALERMRELLQSQRTEAALQIEAADAAYRSGRGAQADVFATRSAVALIDDRQRQTERQLATATTRLVRWVGEAGRAALAPPPRVETTHLDAAHLETQLAHHPEIALLARQEDVARAEADMAQSNQRADWSVELMVSQRGPAYSNMASVSVSIPLQIDAKNRQDRELGARLAQVERLRAQREEATREHTAQTLAWLQEWHSDRERLAHYDGTLLPLAAERTRAALAAYRSGAGSGSGPLASVLDARRVEIDTRMDRLRLEMEAAALWARLEYLVPQTQPQPQGSSSPERAVAAQKE